MNEDFNGLLDRISALENEGKERKQAEALNYILGNFGDQFGGRQDVALELLNQMSLRGIDTSAASSNAIQDIVNAMQAQVDQLAEAFHQKKREVQQLENQAADIAEQVANIDATVAQTVGTEAMSNETEQTPAMGQMPQEAGALSSETLVPGAQPPVEQVPGAQPPVEQAPEAQPPVEQAPEGTITSDSRLKDVELGSKPLQAQGQINKNNAEANGAPGAETLVSDKRFKIVQRPAQPTNVQHNTVVSDARMKTVEDPLAGGHKFASHLINVARRGW